MTATNGTAAGSGRTATEHWSLPTGGDATGRRAFLEFAIERIPRGRFEAIDALVLEILGLGTSSLGDTDDRRMLQQLAKSSNDLVSQRATSILLDFDLGYVGVGSEPGSGSVGSRGASKAAETASARDAGSETE